MSSNTMPANTKNKKLTIRTNDEEYRRIREFARFQGKTISSFIMDMVWAAIEDAEDMKAAEAYLKNPDQQKIPHSEIVKELGLS